MAHPARLRLYELLVLEGRSTVSNLASRADLAVGSVSHHLTQLHRAGLVQEADDPGLDRRKHWWEAVPGGLKWSAGDFVDSPSRRAVASLALQVFTEQRMRYLTQWQRTWSQWPQAWVHAAVHTDAVLQLTPRELREMESDLAEVTRRWAKYAESTPDQEGRQPVFTMTHAFPLPDDTVQRARHDTMPEDNDG